MIIKAATIFLFLVFLPVIGFATVIGWKWFYALIKPNEPNSDPVDVLRTEGFL